MVWMWEGQQPTGALIYSRWTTVWLFLSLGCWCSSLCHNRYVCIRVSVPTCRVHSLGSLTVCTGCLLLPSCEEQGSDMACPFSSLWTFDTPSAEVSLTYFPLAALLLSYSAPQQGGAARAELLTPPLLSWCVKSPPFVRRHVPVCVCVCFFRCVGGIPHTQTHTRWLVLRLDLKCSVGVAGRCWAALGLDPCSELCLTHFVYHCSHPLTSSTYFTSLRTVDPLIPLYQLILLS